MDYKFKIIQYNYLIHNYLNVETQVLDNETSFLCFRHNRHEREREGGRERERGREGGLLTYSHLFFSWSMLTIYTQSLRQKTTSLIF